jgi:hypothetical protein
MKIALAVFALAAICSAQELPPQTIAAAPAPDYSAFTRSYTLPFTGAADFSSLIHVHASINGGPVGSFDVDTGSVGIVVSADDVPNIDPNGEKGSITYSSSGIELDGVYTMATVHFPDAIGDDGQPHPLDVKVKVLAVSKRLCHDMGPNSGKCTPSDHATSHMMGIGFDRGHDEPHPERNVFLSLSEMRAGTMRSGYLIEPDGVHLGLTAKNVGAGFHFQKLLPRPGIPANGPKDWLTAPGGLSVGDGSPQVGTVLMDTGLTNMILSAPGHKHGEVDAGTPIKIYLPAGLSYSFKVGDSGSMTPRKVNFVEPKHDVFINTGLHALAHLDYLYDADGGYLALRPRK